MSEVEDSVEKRLDLTDKSERAMIALLRRDTIDFARFPYSARYEPLKAILAKLDPSAPPPAPKPPLSPGAAPSHGRGSRRR